jgi:uncharacterized protein YceK
MRKVLHGALLSMVVAAVSGCGTLFGRPDASFYPPAKYYQATQYDMQLLFGGDELNRGFVHATAWCWMSLVCPVITVVSIPADIVIDTVFIPHDMAL